MPDSGFQAFGHKRKSLPAIAMAEESRTTFSRTFPPWNRLRVLLLCRPRSRCSTTTAGKSR